jgi:hypothetical protein
VSRPANTAWLQWETPQENNSLEVWRHLALYISAGRMLTGSDKVGSLLRRDLLPVKRPQPKVKVVQTSPTNVADITPVVMRILNLTLVWRVFVLLWMLNPITNLHSRQRKRPQKAPPAERAKRLPNRLAWWARHGRLIFHDDLIGAS